MPKYIFMTGGVVSSLGKGLTFSSIASLLEGRGLKVAMLKLDPYLNVDPGTMNPFEHGEVYVTDDGAETDLDLGHYYRFTNSPLSKASNATSGQIYDTVIKHERRGDYLGKTVQVIPHVTDEIKLRILQCERQMKGIDVVCVEIGGTVGDIESLPFLEAIRQFRLERFGDCLNIHLTYVPYIPAAHEVKTKPTQHSIAGLRQIGIIPDIIVCRCEQPLEEHIKQKISLFCSVPQQHVIDVPDAKHSIYEIPLYLYEQKLDQQICDILKLNHHKCEMAHWKTISDKIINSKESIQIAIVGKYLTHRDAYKSVFESLTHAAIDQNRKIIFHCIESDKMESLEQIKAELKDCDGVVVPGGFGERGFEGKILAAQACRELHIPYFGLCLGMQVIVVEYARNVLHLERANSTEMNPATPYPVICLLEEQKSVSKKGGTMRLGSFECLLTKGSKAELAYGTSTVHERHRHRLEFNHDYKEQITSGGLLITGVEPSQDLCEIVEVKGHPWMVGVQFHPEFKSKPTAPHPLFLAFMKAALAHQKKRS